MNGLFFRQRSEEHSGYTFYKGEDALPYVCDRFMLVADGLGGSGSFSHDHMIPDMWNAESRIALLGEALRCNDDSAVLEYIGKAFEEMNRDSDGQHMPERYEKVPSVYRLHSGYYASRIATTAFINLMRNDEELKPDHLFERLDQEGEKILSEYAELLCERLVRDIRTVAEKANLVKEVSELEDKITLLLPTTLAAALYREREEDTEVICIWAGDSRIVAQLNDGAVQLTIDEEGADGRMTNLITPEWKKPHLCIKRYCIKRPFILMAVSDGTFDEMDSSLSFEVNMIVNAFGDGKNKNNPNEHWNSLRNITVDDSATVAYSTFGLETIEDCAAFVEERTNWIIHNYLEELPELFGENTCKIEKERCFRRAEAILKGHIDEIMKDPGLRASYSQEEQGAPSAEYVSCVARNEDRKKQIEEEKRKLREALFGVVSKHWLEVRPAETEDRKTMKLASSAVQNKAERDKYLEEIRELTQSIGDAVKSIEDMDPDMIPVAIDNMSDFVCELPGKLRGYTGKNESLKKDVRELCRVEAPVIEAYVQKIVSTTPEQLPEVFSDLCGQYATLDASIHELEEENKRVLRECVEQRARRDSREIIRRILQDDAVAARFSPELQEKLQIEKWRAELNEFARKQSLQERIWSDNDRRYYRFIGEEA